MAFDGYTLAVCRDRTCDLSDKGRSLYPLGHMATSFPFYRQKPRSRTVVRYVCRECGSMSQRGDVEFKNDSVRDLCTNGTDEFYKVIGSAHV